MLVLVALLFLVLVAIDYASASGATNETPELPPGIEIVIPFTTATLDIGVYIPLPPIFIGEGTSYKTAKVLTYFFKLGRNTSRFYIMGARIYVLAVIALIVLFIRLLKIPKPKVKR